MEHWGPPYQFVLFNIGMLAGWQGTGMHGLMGTPYHLRLGIFNCIQCQCAVCLLLFYTP